MVPAGNKTKRLSSVNHTTKAIHLNLHHQTDIWRNCGFYVIIVGPVFNPSSNTALFRTLTNIFDGVFLRK